ncbi:MAG: DUF642 domain-containing protein [Isosphaeraceae bacterium]
MRRARQRSLRAPRVESLERRALLTDVLQGGFELPPQSGGYTYRPAGSAWSFAGNSGLSANGTAITSGNPAAPEGAQVAFIQGTGSISQSSPGWSAGQYVIRLIAAQRGNVSGNNADFQLLVDGNVVGSIRPVGGAYAAYTSDPFVVAAGTHAFGIRGVNSAGGDNTALIDGFAVQATPAFDDAGFELPYAGPAGQSGSLLVAPTGTAWGFTGSAGVTSNGTALTSGNPGAPEGSQAAFLQYGTGSAMTQVVPAWPAGTYQITFRAAQRANFQAAAQDLRVLVDGQSVGIFRPTGAAYAGYATVPFTVVAGSHQVTFQALGTAGGDNTAFIDSIALQQASSDATPTFADAGFERPSAGSPGQQGSFVYGPSGSSWTFAGTAGLAANGSGFTAGNPAAPEGSQAAFLQRTGQFSQSVSFASAGSYTVGFRAAQRANWQASYQDFDVLVDGALVSTIRPTDVTYRSYATATFSASAGSHTIAFRGRNTAGGDNTALIDAVSVQASSGVAVGDSGFERVNAGPSGSSSSFVYGPSGSSWTFAGTAGLAANGSGFTAGNPAAPEGSQAAFLQRTGQFSQSVSFASAGSYTVGFRAAQRANWQASYQDFDVLVDGALVSTIRPTDVTYRSYATATFSASAGSHTIAFRGRNTAGGDNTALIDSIAIQPVISNSGLSDPGFESVSVGPVGQISSFAYSPAGSPWTFVGSSGVAANGSGFTSSNPNAPDGTQVLFLQDGGGSAISQVVNGWAAGTAESRSVRRSRAIIWGRARTSGC